MTFRVCLDEIQKAAGRKLTDDELADLSEELARRQQEKLRGGARNIEEAALQAADELGRDMRTAAFIAKRNAALNLKARLTGTDFVRSQFADNPARGVEAILVGVNSARKGARASVAAEQQQLRGWYLAGFISDMEKTGHWSLFTSGAYDRDVARALWAIEHEADLAAMPREAVEMAKVIRKWQDVAKADANAAGAMIGKLDGWIVRQSHDVYRILRAGFAAWKGAVLPRLDIGRTFGDRVDINEALREVWQGLASGIHMKVPEPSGGFKGPRNLAKAMSQERVLHFKSADDWFDYNAEFGTGNLREAILHGLERTAENVGIMRKLGPNHGATFDAIVNDITRGIADPAAQKKFSEASAGWLRGRLAVVDGSARIPVSGYWAKLSAGIRALESLAKLGGAVISSFSDLPVYASELRYQGHGGFLSGIGRGIGALLKGRSRRQMAEIDAGLGVFFDSMRADVLSRFSVAEDGVPGMMSKAMRQFFKWNGLTWWTETLRASAVRTMSHMLARKAGQTWEQIGEELRRVLSLYGIGAKEWDGIRAGATKESDGRLYLTTEGITDRRHADMLRAYLIDRGQTAIIEASPRTRAILTRGTRPGTIEGELLRFIGQFKSFPAAFAERVVGRDLFGRGSDTLGQALRSGHGEMQALAQLVLWMTVFGYGATVVKDIAKGRTPRDPTDPKTWVAAFVQGGGMGIYGDFLFGDIARNGESWLASALGPAAGTADTLYDLWRRMRHKAIDPSSDQDIASTAFRALVNHTPFLNLFYTRLALDYLILWRIQESLNPGAMRRLEQAVQRDNAQTFLVRPSQAVH